MTTTAIAINKINELVSAGNASQELVNLIENLPDDTRASGLEAILTYAIENNLNEMFHLLISSDVMTSLKSYSFSQLWIKVCESDDPAIVDIFLSADACKTGILYESMFCTALSLQSSYAIKNLEGFVSNEAKVSALFSHGNEIGPEMIKALDAYPDFISGHTAQWMDKWTDVECQGDSDADKEQQFCFREKFRLWISLQSDVTLSSMWDRAISRGRAWIGEVLKEEGNPPPAVSESLAHMLIEDGSYDLFRLIEAHRLLENNESLQNALSRLVQMRGQQPFLLHLIKYALPACNNFFCRLLGMPYDRLELRKMYRDFERHVKLTVNAGECSNYTRLIYVGLMIDKFGVEKIAQHACYEWQAEQLIKLGYGPMEIMSYVEENEIKSYLLNELSRF